MRFFTLFIFISVIIASWCTSSTQNIKETHWGSNPKPLSSNYINQTWIVFSWSNEKEINNVIYSWDSLYYKNIYSITTNTILTWFLNTNEMTKNQVLSIKWPDHLLDKELCTPHYEEWINYQPKTIEKSLWDKKIYITYATFDVSGPDMEPFKNYQAEICFVQNDKIYTITIGDTKKYRKDIVEAFKFL